MSPEASRPYIEVSEAHRVLCDDVPPTRDDHVVFDPRPDATMVTLVVPVGGAFVGRTANSSKASNVMDAVSVFTPCSTVATVRRKASVPLAILVWIDDDDTQVDASATEDPIRDRPVEPCAPMCEPTTVTLDVPVAGWLALTIVLGDDAAIDSADVNEPTRTTTVAMTDTVRITPAAGLAITDESATHTVASLVVAPMRWRAVQREAPALVPTTVTVVAPVDAALAATTVLDSGEENVNVADVLASS